MDYATALQINAKGGRNVYETGTAARVAALGGRGTSNAAPQATPVAPAPKEEDTISPQTVGQLAQIMRNLGGQTTTSAAETPLSVLSVGQDPYEEQYNKYSDIFKQQADQEVDPNKLYRDKLKLYQSQIDAVNDIYTQRLNQERLEAQGRMGSTAAVAGRSGTLGSDFGAAQLNQTTGYNADIRSATMAEQAAKIGEIMGEVRKGAADEFAAKTQAKMQGAEAYMEFLKGASERRSSKAQILAQMLLDQGLEPEQVDWDQTLKGSNLSKEEILSTYQSTKKDMEAAQAAAEREQFVKDREFNLDEAKTIAEIAKIEADIEQGKTIKVGEGDMLYNIETDTYFKNPKTATPESGLTSDIKNYEYAKSNGYTGSFDQWKGSGGGDTKPIVSGALTVSQQEIAEMTQALNQNRGGTVEDNFTDTGLYIQAYDTWLENGGLEDDFFEQFPPTSYLNKKDKEYWPSGLKKWWDDN